MDVEFGTYRLKRQERLLLGPDGPVELSGRSFDILTVLLDTPNQLIGKAELFDAVWPGVVVEENTLQVHVSALRKALVPNMIVTVHGRGYKYGGPQPVPVAPASVRREPVTLSSVENTTPRKPVVAVVPFENQSGNRDQQYFSEGITQDITDSLTRFRMLSVIGQHSAFAFRSSAPDFVGIREKLRADFVVTGSIRRSDDRIRVTVRLSDARSETAVWAERYDRPLSGIFELQDELTDLIAAAVANQLEIEIAAWSGGRNPTNFACYESILQGHWHFKKLDMESNEKAIASYEQALALDPRNAEAMSSLAMCYSSGWLYEFSIPKLEMGVEFATRAIEYDPSAAKSHAVLGFGLLWLQGLDAAKPPMERALVLNPSEWFGLTNRSMISVYEGKPAEARQLLDQARRLNTMPPIWLTEFECVSHFGEGRFADVLPGVEPIPDGAWDMMYAISSYGHLGLAEKACATLARFSDQGRSVDFLFGAMREPYRDPAIRERLSEGIRKALSF